MRWMKPSDAMYVEPTIRRISCPILKQLLGCTTSHQGLFDGNGADQPLRQWLHDYGVDSSMGQNGLGQKFLEGTTGKLGQGLKKLLENLSSNLDPKCGTQIWDLNLDP